MPEVISLKGGIPSEPDPAGSVVTLGAAAVVEPAGAAADVVVAAAEEAAADDAEAACRL